MHQELHWLDIPEWVNYKLGVLTHWCLLGKAPVYLSNCCIPVSHVATRRHLRSTARHQLTVPRHRLSTYGRRAFAVTGLTLCQMIYEILQSAHRPSDSRWRLIFSLPISMFSALGVSHVMRSINVRYLLTYLYVLPIDRACRDKQFELFLDKNNISRELCCPSTKVCNCKSVNKTRT